MRRTLVVMGLFLIPLLLLSPQGMDNPEVLEKFGLNEEEIERVMDIQAKAEKIIEGARLELNLLKAQLEKLLFDVNVSMKEVEKLLKSSLEWKLKAELAEIDPSEVVPDRPLRELGVDSLMVLELVAFIEKRTEIEIPEEEISKVKCLDDIFAGLRDGWRSADDRADG